MERIRIDYDIVDVIVDRADVKTILFQYEEFKFATSEQYAHQYFYDIWLDNAYYFEIVHGITYEIREEYEDIIVPLVTEKIDAYFKENGTEIEL